MKESGTKVTVAAVQLSSGTHVASNVATAIELVGQAADRGAGFEQTFAQRIDEADEFACPLDF